MEKKEVKAEPGKGLMRKTKVELVEIILRKDDLERNLREELKTIKADLKENKENCDIFKSNIEDMSEDYNELKTSSEELLDKYINDGKRYKKEVNNANTACVISIIINLILIGFLLLI